MPDNSDWIIDELPSRLESLVSDRVEVLDAARGILKAGGTTFVAASKSSGRLPQVAQAAETARAIAAEVGGDAIPVVVVPHMPLDGSAACTAHRVGFVDLSGNGHLEFPRRYIHVEGRPSLFTRRGLPTSAFAPRCSRVSRVLLADPTQWWTESDLAARTGLSPDLVARIVRRLDEDSLITFADVNDDDAPLRPENAGRLLDAWRNRHDFVQESRAFCCGRINDYAGRELLARVAASLERHSLEFAATGDVSGDAMVIVYLRGPRLDLVFLDEFDFHPGADGANVWLSVPEDEAVLEASAEADGIPFVGTLQRYLDLKHLPESEARHQAESRCRAMLAAC